MKKDSSRDTFSPQKHYDAVLMQQGRVQLDSDWNEQSNIVAHRACTEASDVIGLYGGPLHHAGFHIVAAAGELSADEKKLPENANPPAGFTIPDFLIGAGRYYVDGILCENERLTSFASQPDLPAATLIREPGTYLVYLDVWQRHLTALDDPSIRESALGGPDTTTRSKTVWQVKLTGPYEKGTCLQDFPDFTALTAPSNGTLSAKTKLVQSGTGPCIVPPGAGYRGLENQLYRVEVHQTATASIVIIPEADTLTSRVTTGARRPTVTYKWSRNNGAIVTTIENMAGAEITVHDLGPDAVLGFTEGQWVEISDDGLELNGLPGQLALISKIDRAINLVTLDRTATPLSAQSGGVDKTLHPKLRGWDGIGTVALPSDYLDLENGVQVSFVAGTFRTGDYWTIPARTATADAQSGNIEWPTDASGTPQAQLPFGIKHHYCRLAMLHWDGKSFDTVSDCRNLFPPVTELTSFLYVSGDGQEAMPGHPLPQLLQVGVFNWRWPVSGAEVQFVALSPGREVFDTQLDRFLPGFDPIHGHLAASMSGLNGFSPNTLRVETGADGIASCAWLLDPRVARPSQQVEAHLLDSAGNPLPAVIRFNGNLSIADQVFYDPGQCKTLSGQTTVQKAVDKLASLVSLYQVSGNDQDVMPGAVLDLVVLAANECGPVSGQKVSFHVVEGHGTVTPPVIIREGTGITTAGVITGGGPTAAIESTIDVAGTARVGLGGGPVKPLELTTNTEGIATVKWTPDLTTPRQQVDVRLVDEAVPSITTPTSVRFVANLSMADQVYYDPGQCPAFEGRDTVQKAVDQLAHLVSLYEFSGNNQEVLPGARLEPLVVLAANKCGRKSGQKVSLKVVAGRGTVEPLELHTSTDGFANVNVTAGSDTPVKTMPAGIAIDKIAADGTVTRGLLTPQDTAVWTLDPTTPRQQLEASLVDEAAPSVTPPTAVLFTVDLHIASRVDASQVAYDPANCADLKTAGATTVRKALDELCKQTPKDDPGIRIEKVLTVSDNHKLANDTLVAVSRLQEGITIICNESVVDTSFGSSPDLPPRFQDTVAGKPTCFVTLDLPFPSGGDKEFWQADIIGFQPTILSGSASAEERQIHWAPSKNATDWLPKILALLFKSNIADRLLAHLTLKGNFIWSKSATGELLYLDGDAFGTPSSDGRVDLLLSGDGRKGGDFEMWFWLVQDLPPAKGLTITASAGKGTIQGSVQSAGSPLPGVTVTLTAVPAAPPAGTILSAADLTRSNVPTNLPAAPIGGKPTTTTDKQGNFSFAQLAPGSYRVSVESGGLSAQETVVVV